MTMIRLQILLSIVVALGSRIDLSDASRDEKERKYLIGTGIYDM